jgi:hypothetical protein
VLLGRSTTERSRSPLCARHPIWQCVCMWYYISGFHPNILFHGTAHRRYAHTCTSSFYGQHGPRCEPSSHTSARHRSDASRRTPPSQPQELRDLVDADRDVVGRARRQHARAHDEDIVVVLGQHAHVPRVGRRLVDGVLLPL